MKTTISLGIFFFLFITSGCATLTSDIEVEGRTDPMVELITYETYAWIEPDHALYDPEGRWEAQSVDINAEVKWLVDRELRSLNMIEVKGDQVEPDLYVTFTIRSDLSNFELQTQPYFLRNKEEYSPKAELSVVLVDGVTGFIAWVGKATANVTAQPKAKQLRKRLDYTVYKLFELYPVINQK